MIDEKALEKISQLRADRKDLIKAYEWFSDDNHDGYCQLPTDYEKYVSMSSSAFLNFLLGQIEILIKELISLGFQPSPLDLKEGAKAND